MAEEPGQSTNSSGAGPSGTKVDSGWPEVLNIQSLPPVEKFDEALLPLSFRPLVLDSAERMQVPPDYAAAAIIVCLAGAVNRRATIHPKAHDLSWIVVPNLWGAIVAPPGFLKSPIIKVAVRSLEKIQAEIRQEFERDTEEFNVEQEKFSLKLSAWREQYKKAAKAGRTEPPKPEESPEEPRLKRLLANDSTFEKLHEILEHNPGGILVIRDELTGWWSTLDRQGREGERAFFLQAWNGDTTFTVDRIGRGTIHVEACCVSMLGGIQPARLRSYLAGALAGRPDESRPVAGLPITGLAGYLP